MPRWIRKYNIDRVRGLKAGINDRIELVGAGRPQNSTELHGDLWDLRRFTLLDLYALGKVDVVEDEKRMGRYFAVIKKKPLFVCEITKDTFESLAHTDLPERTRKELLKEPRGRLGWEVQSIS